MKFSDITIFQAGVFVFRKHPQPSDKTKYFIICLIHDPYFIDEIKRIRAKYNIPIDGYPYKILQQSTAFLKERIEGVPLHKEEYFISRFTYPPNTPTEEEVKIIASFTSDEQRAFVNHSTEARKKEREQIKGDDSYVELYKSMEKDLDELGDYYRLSTKATYSLFLLIAYNSFINIDELGYNDKLFIVDKSQISRWLEHFDEKMGAILIGEFTNKTNLIKWIRKNWKEMIGYQMDYLPRVPSKEDYPNLELAEEALELKEEGKTNKEIEAILIPKYKQQFTIPTLKAIITKNRGILKRFSDSYKKLNQSSQYRNRNEIHLK
jgi:hypothetical protein